MRKTGEFKLESEGKIFITDQSEPPFVQYSGHPITPYFIAFFKWRRTLFSSRQIIPSSTPTQTQARSPLFGQCYIEVHRHPPALGAVYPVPYSRRQVLYWCPRRPALESPHESFITLFNNFYTPTQFNSGHSHKSRVIFSPDFLWTLLTVKNTWMLVGVPPELRYHDPFFLWVSGWPPPPGLQKKPDCWWLHAVVSELLETYGINVEKVRKECPRTLQYDVLGPLLWEYYSFLFDSYSFRDWTEFNVSHAPISFFPSLFLPFHWKMSGCFHHGFRRFFICLNRAFDSLPKMWFQNPVKFPVINASQKSTVS